MSFPHDKPLLQQINQLINLNNLSIKITHQPAIFWKWKASCRSSLGQRENQITIYETEEILGHTENAIEVVDYDPTVVSTCAFVWFSSVRFSISSEGTEIAHWDFSNTEAF